MHSMESSFISAAAAGNVPTLKPKMQLSVEDARLTSDLLMSPGVAMMNRSSIFSCGRAERAALMASQDPDTSVLRMIFMTWISFPSAEASDRTRSLAPSSAQLFSFLTCICSSAFCLASFSDSNTSKRSPAVGTSFSPRNCTGKDGVAYSTFSPRSLVMERTRPQAPLHTMMSPTARVPFCTSTVATAPLLRSKWASTTVPVAPAWGLALSSATSAVSRIISRRSSMPSPFLALMGTMGVSPPHSSLTRPYSASSPLIFSMLAPSLSILLMPTMMGTLAAWQWAIASRVWGRTPSSAATTMMVKSVTVAPRARIAVKASCPGVSMKVM
mmetsp:Transcript_10027/g.18938  ORF Transcript_10027/g.18938 Transcript_10027/m.18938 type:complete len:328 (-) Transcript_10027:690-1673(-)